MECGATDSNFFPIPCIRMRTYYSYLSYIIIVVSHTVYSEGATVGPELIGC